MKHELLVRSKGKCQKCGISLKGMKPDIHHKNRNPSDNEISNLMVLCRNCHSKMHYNKDGTLKKSTTKIGRKKSKQNEKPISKKELLNQLPKTKLKQIVKKLDLDYDGFWDGDEKEDYIDFLSSSRAVTVKKIRETLGNNTSPIKSRKTSNQGKKPISKKELLNQLPKTKLKKIVKELDLEYDEFWDGDEKEDYIDFLSSSGKATVKKIEKIL